MSDSGQYKSHVVVISVFVALFSVGFLFTRTYGLEIGQFFAAEDRDADTVLDERDNCQSCPNPLQRDDDKDGRGNKCDLDYINNDCENILCGPDCFSNTVEKLP